MQQLGMIFDEEPESYYLSIPVGKQNAISRDELCELWNVTDRKVRNRIEHLRRMDNGDDMIIVSSSQGSGYYRTNDRNEIKAFKEETSKRAKRTFGPLKKINRILSAHEQQVSMVNDWKIARLDAGLSQSDVVNLINESEERFDKSILSKIENGLVLPNPELAGLLNSLYRSNIESAVMIQTKYK